MNLPTVCAAAGLLLLVSAETLIAELYAVVRVTDLRGNANFQVCTEESRRKIEAELSEEAKALPKAVGEAKEEWVKKLNVEAFPSTRVKPRTLKVLATAISREAADKALAQARIKEERELAEAREEARTPKVRQAGRGAGAAVLEQRQDLREERERDEVADRAEALVRQRLSAAVGRAVPFFGEAEAQKKAPMFKKR